MLMFVAVRVFQATEVSSLVKDRDRLAKENDTLSHELRETRENLQETQAVSQKLTATALDHPSQLV